MKLSIIIPTYNSASVLPRALDSIVGQTFTDWEVLVNPPTGMPR
jgi:glycosyltransferase involved in cell wall biosynthesis